MEPIPAARWSRATASRADCADELPNVANARFWSEQEDGSVAFIMEDGRVALRFAAGDGHAFETYEAGAPLISLIAKVD
jgi:hypothetical protein